MMDASQIVENLQSIKKRIIAVEQQCEQANSPVQLVAVSKGQSVAAIVAASAAGQLAFAENYVQEALSKIQALQQYGLTWHFIGNIQANKTKAIAENFAWVQSVSRLKIAERLQQQRLPHLPPLNICLEVKLSHEKTKSGIDPSELWSLASAIQAMPRLRLRGLMTIAAATDDVSVQRAIFHELHMLYQHLKTAGLPLDTLSMGMSHDFEAAIAEGSNMVRIGTAIFGERN